MSEMTVPVSSPVPAIVQEAVESPPPARAPARDPLPDPRARLHQLAGELIRTQNRRLLVEYLRARRAVL
jgi:hypothetical protein